MPPPTSIAYLKRIQENFLYSRKAPEENWVLFKLVFLLDMCTLKDLLMEGLYPTILEDIW